ncbi:hypothetical protein [Thermomonas sp.]|uniref:hypothetical protein n=1 Tax=Thermomonas sp. TaxID=1971895 RepID=UPI00262A1C50|nr:hypothetical protein [Thermomonas sp.]MCO5055844.1 hypothetical protein [Thermomonas sp.]
MTAGTSATADASSIASHATDSYLPYTPRKLTRGERSRREVFVFFSPRNQRVVTIADAINAAVALKLEFDPNIQKYIERPRRIRFTVKQQIDVSFWTRNKSGEERFYLVVPEAGTIGSTTGTVSIRNRAELDDAALRNGIRLHYVTEPELLSARTWLATGFELLPLVWDYGRLATRSLIRNQIRARLVNTERVSISNLINTLDFTPANVRAVVAAMIHQGELQLADYLPGAADAVLEVVRA